MTFSFGGGGGGGQKSELPAFQFFYSSVPFILSAQEPITGSVQLPYSACETAFLQVELFLDIKAFTQISSQ